MKKQTRTKIRNLRRDILSWLRLAAKTLRRRFVAAGKRFEPFPNEAPH
jgi:hypothetical protein